MKIDKRRIKNANRSLLDAIKIIGLVMIFLLPFLGFVYLITKISYWFILLIIPLTWVIGYFIEPNKPHI